MSELPHLDFLFTAAEVAAAFVGFSLVVSVFRPESSSDAVRMGSLRDVAEIGLSAIAASFAPYVFHVFDFSSEAIWRASSLLFALGGFVAFYLGYRRFSRLGGAPPWRTAPLFALASGVLTLLGSGLLWWNVLSPSARSGPRYVLALLLLLALAGLIFVFAAFRRPDSPVSK
jgi:hypothetical protein